MLVIEDLDIETEIPLTKVTTFRFKWNVNEHASLRLEGILDAGKKDTFLQEKYNNTKIVIRFKKETLFNGLVRETNIQASGGMFVMLMEAASASCMLDQKRHSEMFQDSSMTYKSMIHQVVENASGNLICTTGDYAIGRPLLCFEETVWQYAVRMASHIHSYVMPDVITGNPGFWFGLRRGKRREDRKSECREIELQKCISKKGRDWVSFCIASKESYQLGDFLLWEDKWTVIYKKEANLERGEIRFLYWTAFEGSLRSETLYHEKITGLSLKGTVTKVKEEHVYLKMDIDGKAGIYPFPWYPETGTGLYCMPEPGAKVELQFMSHDERGLIAVRCRDTGDIDNETRKLELPDGASISMDTTGLKMEKKDKLQISDCRMNIFGERGLQMSALGKVNITAKTIEIIAKDEIRYNTNM